MESNEDNFMFEGLPTMDIAGDESQSDGFSLFDMKLDL